MSHVSAQLPELPALEAGLTIVLNDDASRGAVAVVARSVNPYSSSVPTEVVSCRCAGGEELTLLCKYAPAAGPGAFEHRGGILYEAQVYRGIVWPAGLSVPRYYGVHTEGSGECWLVLEYLQNAARVHKAGESPGLVGAAHWIARFHAATEPLIRTTAFPFLKRRDAEHCRQWVERAATFSKSLCQRLPWFAGLCDLYARTVIPLLTAGPSTIVHGEYYPNNILVRDGAVCPVDWESAAAGAGEIDLASLVDGWPDETAAACIAEYRQTRWPDGAPPDFDRRLMAAQLYWAFRWLGHRQEWTLSQKMDRRFQRLRRLAEHWASGPA